MVALLLWGSLCFRLTRFSGLGSSQGCSEQLSFLRERHCVSALDLKPKNKQRLLWLYLFIIMLALSSILLFLPVFRTAQMARWYPVYVAFWSQCNSDHFWFWSCSIKTSKTGSDCFCGVAELCCFHYTTLYTETDTLNSYFYTEKWNILWNWSLLIT